MLRATRLFRPFQVRCLTITTSAKARFSTGSLPFELNSDQIRCLGADPNIVKSFGLTKTPLSKPNIMFFSGCEVDYYFPKASSKNVYPEILKHNCPINVIKYCNKFGFFPSVAAHTVKMTFRNNRVKLGDLTEIKNKLEGFGLACSISDKTKFPEHFVISHVDIENSILEFDFFPHNLGFVLHTLKRTE